MKDHQFGWPAALANIDAPYDYRRELRTPPAPRFTEAEQEARRKLDVQPEAKAKAKAEVWHDTNPPRYGWYIAAMYGKRTDVVRYFRECDDKWSHACVLGENDPDKAENQMRRASTKTPGVIKWLRPATEEDFGFPPPEF
jgi:hypothetical protein